MKTKGVTVVPYDPSWPIEFGKIKSQLADALGSLALSIEHVGSTSVPGLAAKPIIDIDVIISSRKQLPAVIIALATIGYRHEGDLGIKGLMKHHLYICSQESVELKRHLMFRDYLRFHAEAVEEYGNIKKEGAKLYPIDMDAYIKYKTPVIEKIYRQAGIKLEEHNI